MTSPAEPTEDGRTARRDRNREAVLDAVLELFTEDCLAPSAHEVAERSGVSLRSVYRYYEDMGELVRAAIARNVDRVRPLLELGEVGEGPIDARIDAIVTGRLTLYETMAPTMRASLLRARSSELIRTQLEANRSRLLDQVLTAFAPELRSLPAGPRKEVAAAIDVLLGFESLEHLRRHRSLSAPAVRRILDRAVRSMLTAAGIADADTR